MSSFYKIFKETYGETPLRDVVLKSIDERNLLGEGLAKKGYNFIGLKDYVIRIYKSLFKFEDLNIEFQKPINNFQNRIEEVVLTIPLKIDIVKKKQGATLGFKEYGMRTFPPNYEAHITRAETLDVMAAYESIKRFPINSFAQIYKTMKLFCKEPGYQHDIVNPNNMLIDFETKKINLIDPMTPTVNCCEEKPINLLDQHGSDSIYPVLCDFLMHSEHLENLTNKEKFRWKDDIRAIIAKSIKGGIKSKCNRNLEKLEELYILFDSLWNAEGTIVERYNKFVNLYHDTIKSK